MSHPKPHAIIVGAGVIGLTSALALEKRGWAVTVIASYLSPDTTSDIAAAVWFPFVIQPAERALPWALQAYHVFEQLAKEDTSAGVDMCAGMDLFESADPPEPVPWWRPSLPPHVPVYLVRADGSRTQPGSETAAIGAPASTESLRTHSYLELDHSPTRPLDAPPHLPQGFQSAWEVVCPVVEMKNFMPWLHVQCALRGIRVIALGKELGSLNEALKHVGKDTSGTVIIVNCTGLGAAKLLDDSQVYPVQGQIVHVKYPKDRIPTRRFYFDEATERLAYIIPLREVCVLGGTARKGAYGTTPDPAEACRIVRDCAKIEPALADAPIIRHVVGLRPGRTNVRLEIEWCPKDCAVPVIHNYGHGGNGVTVCFGCAEEVVQLADTILKKHTNPNAKL